MIERELQDKVEVTMLNVQVSKVPVLYLALLLLFLLMILLSVGLFSGSPDHQYDQTRSSRSTASRSSMNARLLARENISLAVNVSSQSVQGFPVILDASNPPSFWIIGAQKGGTSVMNHWLQSLPNIAMRPNELHFFDRAAWNCSFRVCTSFYMNESRFYQNFRHILPPDPSLPYGAKAPSYLYIPVVPRALSKYFPSMKIIVMLRNPVKRAYSGYGQAWGSVPELYERRESALISREKGESLTVQLRKIPRHGRFTSPNYALLFDHLARQELSLIATATKRIQSGDYSREELQPFIFEALESFETLTAWDLLFKILQASEFGSAQMKDFYILKSHYTLQLKHWHQFFDKSQFLYLLTEEVFADATATLHQIENFLHARPLRTQPKSFPEQGKSRTEVPMLDSTSFILQRFFKPQILELETLINKKLDVWYGNWQV